MNLIPAANTATYIVNEPPIIKRPPVARQSRVGSQRSRVGSQRSRVIKEEEVKQDVVEDEVDGRILALEEEIQGEKPNLEIDHTTVPLPNNNQTEASSTEPSQE